MNEWQKIFSVRNHLCKNNNLFDIKSKSLSIPPENNKSNLCLVLNVQNLVPRIFTWKVIYFSEISTIIL